MTNRKSHIDKGEYQIPAIINRSVHQFETALAKRIFYCIESQIEKGFGIQLELFEPNKLVYQVPTKLLGNQHFKDLDKATEELQKIRFKFIDPINEHFNKVVPFPVVQYQKGWGHMKITVQKEAMAFLAELTGGYYYIHLKAMLTLKSYYAQRWYELFSEKKDVGFFNRVTVEYIREIMNIKDGDYKRNSDMLTWVVYNAIKEINEKTDLLIEFTYLNDARRPVQGFNFTIKHNNATNEAKIYKGIDEFYNNLVKQGGRVISNKFVELCNKYGFTRETQAFLMYPENKHVLNEVMTADILIEENKVTIQTTKQKYMAGVIKKASNQ